MKFPLSIFALFSAVVSTAQAKCAPSPKVTPKAQYAFTINLTLGASSDLGVDIYNARQTYLPVEGGSFCAKWNGGVTGTVIPQTGGVSYYQTANGTGPYKLVFEYLLKTSDATPAFILVKQTGWEVNYSGRTTYVFETGDTRYSAVNTAVYVGVETGYVINGTKTYSSADGYALI